MKKGTQIFLSITICFVFLITGVFIGRQMTQSGMLIDTQIPRTEETLSTSLSDGKININTATLDELMLLPNIGEKLAGRIIEYREKNGDFKTLEKIVPASTLEYLTSPEAAPVLEKLRRAENVVHH